MIYDLGVQDRRCCRHWKDELRPISEEASERLECVRACSYVIEEACQK